jgi:hypothetical protein
MENNYVGTTLKDAITRTLEYIKRDVNRMGELRVFDSQECTNIYNAITYNNYVNPLYNEVIDKVIKATTVHLYVYDCSASDEVLEYRALSILLAVININASNIGVRYGRSPCCVHQAVLDEDLGVYAAMAKDGLERTVEAIKKFNKNNTVKTTKLI